MIKKLLQGYMICNILSIDVALGAVVSALFFGQILDIQIKLSGLVALGLTVWMIYTADHLLDARKIKHDASTVRHRFHQRHFKVLVALLVLAAAGVFIQLFFIRRPVIIGGMILGWIVVIYFLTLKQLKYLKELAGAILYTGGVLVAPLSLSYFELSPPQLILTLEFFITALVNLLIFSWFDVDKDIEDDRKSFATYYGSKLTVRLVTGLLTLNVLLSLLVLLQYSSHGWETLIILVMNMVLAALVALKKYFSNHDRYRILGDAIFFFPILYLLLK